MKKHFIMLLQRFNEGNQGGSGEGGEGGTGAGTGNAGSGGAGNSGTGGAGTGDNGQGGQSKPHISFPDEASFMARISREAKKQLGDFVKGLGFDDEAALRGIVDTHKANVENQKTELQKLTDAKNLSDQAAANALGKLNNTVRTTEAKLLAVELGVKTDRIDYLLKLADLDGVEVKDGSVDKSILKENIEKVLTAMPELKGQSGTQRGGQDFGQGQGQGNALTMEAIRAMSPQEAEKRLPEIMAFMTAAGNKK